MKMSRGNIVLQNPVPAPAYQDDAYLVGSLSDIAKLWPEILHAFREGGHELNLAKSEVWIPGCDEVPTELLLANCYSRRVRL